DSQQRAVAGQIAARRDSLSPPIPPIPWMDADRKALQGAGIFKPFDTGEDRTRNPPKEVIEQRFRALRTRKPGDALVVYLAAYAKADARGKVQILAYDSDPYRPETLVPLDHVLNWLKECPARSKLLVLDVMRTTPDPADLGGTADGVADLLRDELDARAGTPDAADPHLLVLAACAPGQTGLGSEALGRSVFAHFFLLGLGDPQADADGNRAVSVKELARYLDRKVGQWAAHYRGTTQRPRLYGSGPDFDLASLTKAKPKPSAKWAWRWPWKAAPPPPAEAPEAAQADAAPPKAATTPEGKASGKVPEPPPLPGGMKYPRWLADGWHVRDGWWAADDHLAAPRVFRRLDAVLLRAERRWRGGGDPETLRAEFAEERGRLEAAMDRARKLPHPETPVSVGQARALGRTLDKDLAVALKRLLSFRASQIDAPRRKEFLDKLQGLTSLDLAGAVVDALADRSLTPETLDLLDRADAYRHEAEVMSLPRAVGFAPVSQTAATWAKARDAYSLVLTFQERLGRARVVRGKALILLRASIPYAETAGAPDFEAAWFEAAGQVRELDGLLARPDRPLPEDPLAELNRALNDAVRDLSRSTAVLESPFRADAVSPLVERCTSKRVRPDTALARKVEACLLCPFLPSRPRQELWAAGRVLDRRLDGLPTEETGADETPEGVPRERLARRLRRAAALAGLAGHEIDLKRPAAAVLRGGSDDPSAVWPAVAETFRAVHVAFEGLTGPSGPPDPLDRPGWVAPVFALDWQRNPTRYDRLRLGLAGYARLAARYLHEARDLNDTDLADTVKFYEDAALACAGADPDSPGAGGLPAETALEGTVTPRTGLKLSSAHPDDRAEVQFFLRAPQGTGPQELTLS
ncbi:MAG: hypothetical protein LC745_01810, partial [Planctomycetia bacterium]|nr:hypothetical protein [Planctomycetia bacterium]